MKHPCQRSTPIAISPEVDVRFPAYPDSLARIQAIKAVSSWQGKIAVITDRYWEACQRLQITAKTHYDTFCKEAESLEQFGGVTDMELQQTVARVLSKRYAESEKKLAENAKIWRPEESIAESPQPDAKHILRRAFAANSSPTDAERDYLAQQTGMTYRQVTVWFQNNRSRRISTLPKRGRQQSSVQPVPMTSPPQSASTMGSLHEVEQHLRNPTDSPLAQHITLPTTRPPPNPISTPPIPAPPIAHKTENKEPAIVSRSHLMITEPRSSRAFDGHAREGNGDVVQGQTRKIVPLRKSRLAGKKPAPPAQDGTKQCPAVPTRQIRVYSPTEGVQLNPTDILTRAQDEQNRTVSSSSVDAVDSALDVDASGFTETGGFVKFVWRCGNSSAQCHGGVHKDGGIAEGGAEQGTMDDVQLEYLFESMSSKEGEVDPAIWEMLRGILSSDVNQSDSDVPAVCAVEGTGVLPMTPAPTPVDGVQGSTENDPFAALAIDLPTLLGSTPQGSLTTPNVISDTIPPVDSVLAAGTNNLPTAASGETMNGKEREPDWQGLLDFTEMFDAFWTMVDTPAEGSAPSRVRQ
ncbi:hypothetical protein QFC20_006406 [Naganishia adeliensis]|uniref:Uncharacterized protein n=1 Tax=Naganishia adeliensis TaxID=92952 RepID=A0ACC2VB14_9TREE|nr:hypothetical protein QFC20_006406 [Naganishia adeliensis]